MTSFKWISRAGIVALAVAAGATSWAQQGAKYSIYEVYLSSQRDRDRLANSPLNWLPCELRPGWNEVAVGKGQEMILHSLGLKSQFSYVYQPEIPQTGNQDGLDYRTQWLNHDQIIAEWEQLRADYPHIVSRRQIGTSHQGRPIWGYRIFLADRADVATPRKSIIISANAHAREWISPSVAMHLGKKLAETLATTESTFTNRLVDKVGVYFCPINNPDGYVHTWTTNRLWRKNRRDNGNGSFGVDLNRNYNVNWGGAGSSTNPSNDTYCGPSPFSEPEAQAIRDWSLSLPNKLCFIDLHSYGQLIIWPWGHTTTPSAHEALHSSVGNAMRTAILSSGGVTYTAGKAAATLGYLTTGSSRDWNYQQYLIPSYTIELRNTSSFDPPTSIIAPTQDEQWAAFQAMVATVAP